VIRIVIERGKDPVTTDRTAYDSYLRATELHSLQFPVSGTDAEWSFLIICQVQELYFDLIGRDLGAAIGHCDRDEVAAAVAALRRAAGHFVGLNASWASLGFMTPRDFQPIKTAMGATYGRSSSLQSWTYREMVYRLGLKDPELAAPLEGAEDQHAELVAALEAPSVDDAVVGVLARRGFGVPAEYASPGATRPAGEQDPRPEVERAWGEVYGTAPEYTDLVELGDALFALAEGFADYKHRHYLATHRTLGHRPGYHPATSGVAWLQHALTDLPFPELWTLRVPGE
jgi:tryptophan 2,3-dioxygenase